MVCTWHDAVIFVIYLFLFFWVSWCLPDMHEENLKKKKNCCGRPAIWKLQDMLCCWCLLGLCLAAIVTPLHFHALSRSQILLYSFQHNHSLNLWSKHWLEMIPPSLFFFYFQHQLLGDESSLNLSEVLCQTNILWGRGKLLVAIKNCWHLRY